MYRLDEDPKTNSESSTYSNAGGQSDKTSKFQDVVVARNKWWGNVTYLDGTVNVNDRE
jgi:hypothetical protein